MGTISSLADRLSRKPELPSILVTSFGFSVGGSFFPWQTVSEIWGYKVDRITTDETFFEFLSGSQRIVISEEQPGFDQLESSMIAAFPTTAAWRQAVPQPAFDSCRMLLYRRT